MLQQQDIRSISLPNLEALFASWGEPRFRAKQLYEWLWVKGATDWEMLTNVPKALRAKLAEQFTFHALLEDKTQHSGDGTIKSRWLTHDGHRIESVLIPVPDDDRFTVFVSTQLRCSLTCAFSPTSQMVHNRNLIPVEIFEQLLKNLQAMLDLPTPPF